MAETWPKGARDQWEQLIAQTLHDDRFSKIPPELQTDKNLVKVLPCQYCRRPLIVSTFYVLAWAKCSPCKGESDEIREPGSVEVVQAGRTDPRLAKDLTKTLVNPEFAFAQCPVHRDDPEHVMRLLHVDHNDNYGPYVLAGYEHGQSVYKQIAPGESVMHQCQVCLATVHYSTTAVTKMRPMNDARERSHKHVNNWANELGIEPYEPPVAEEVDDAVSAA
jgi:hypothetical protein